MLPVKDKNDLMKKFVKELAPSPWQLLNGQGYKESEGYRNLRQDLKVESFCGKGTKVCEQLRKKELDMCCLQEVRWRGQGTRFVGTRNWTYKLQWSGNNNGIGVGILVKKELCERRPKKK